MSLLSTVQQHLEQQNTLSLFLLEIVLPSYANTIS